MSVDLIFTKCSVKIIRAESVSENNNKRRVIKIICPVRTLFSRKFFRNNTEYQISHKIHPCRIGGDRWNGRSEPRTRRYGKPKDKQFPRFLFLIQFPWSDFLHQGNTETDTSLKNRSPAELLAPLKKYYPQLLKEKIYGGLLLVYFSL